MKQIACLIWALVGWYKQRCNRGVHVFCALLLDFFFPFQNIRLDLLLAMFAQTDRVCEFHYE